MAEDLFKTVGNKVKKTVKEHPSVVGGAALGTAASLLLPGGPLVWGVAGGVVGALKEKRAKEAGKE